MRIMKARKTLQHNDLVVEVSREGEVREGLIGEEARELI